MKTQGLMQKGNLLDITGENNKENNKKGKQQEQARKQDLRKGEMNMETTMRRKHKVFDRPLLGMFVAMIVTLFMVQIGAGFALTGLKLAAGEHFTMLHKSLAMIIAAAVFMSLYKFWFRGEMNDYFTFQGTRKGLLMAAFITVFLVENLWSFVKPGAAIGNPMVALIMGMAPGIAEEVIFRLIPISIAMRGKDREKMIKISIIVTSLLFGLAHAINFSDGAALSSTAIQVVYTFGLGILFSAIYLRTGNIWVTMILHTILDTTAFLAPSLQASGGLMTASTSTLDLVIITVQTIVMIGWALYLVRKEKRQEIMDRWEAIWG